MQSTATSIHPVVTNLTRFCFSTTNPKTDPLRWESLQQQQPSSASSLVSSSQLLQTIVNEVSSFRTTTTNNNNSSSSSSPKPQPQHELLQLHQRGTMRRIIIARCLFRSLLQPVVSNLLVNAFKSQAMRYFVTQSENNIDNNKNPELVKNILSTLKPISSIKTKNTLLKLLHFQPDLLQKEVLFEFMRSAGFQLSQQNDSENSYLEEGVYWQWEGVPLLEKYYERSSENDDENTQVLFNSIKEALSKLKKTETEILSPLEKMLTDRGGLLTVDRISILGLEVFQQQQQQQKQEASAANNNSLSLLDDLLKKEMESLMTNNNKNSSSHEKEDFEVVSQVLAAKNEARKKAQDEENQKRFQQAKEQAKLEVEAEKRAKIAEEERKQKEVSEHDAKVASVQPLLKQARKTLHETGRLRNSSFAGVEWSIQPLNVATRIHACLPKSRGGLCEESNGLEVHWHLRAAPNVLYCFTAHLNADGTKFLHLGEEIGYQYNTVPGMPHFGKTTMVNKKLVDENGKLEKIEANLSKEVTTCVCGKSFADVLWK